MARKPKTARNDQIVNLRNQDPEKYTFPVLGDMFKLRKETVHEIYHRENNRKNAMV